MAEPLEELIVSDEYMEGYQDGVEIGVAQSQEEAEQHRKMLRDARLHSDINFKRVYTYKYGLVEILCLLCPTRSPYRVDWEPFSRLSHTKRWDAMHKKWAFHFSVVHLGEKL